MKLGRPQPLHIQANKCLVGTDQFSNKQSTFLSQDLSFGVKKLSLGPRKKSVRQTHLKTTLDSSRNQAMFVLSDQNSSFQLETHLQQVISRKVEPVSNLLGKTGSMKRKKNGGNLEDFQEIGIDAVSIGKFRKKLLAQNSSDQKIEQQKATLEASADSNQNLHQNDTKEELTPLLMINSNELQEPMSPGASTLKQSPPSQEAMSPTLLGLISQEAQKNTRLLQKERRQQRMGLKKDLKSMLNSTGRPFIPKRGEDRGVGDMRATFRTTAGKEGNERMQQNLVISGRKRYKSPHNKLHNNQDQIPIFPKPLILAEMTMTQTQTVRPSFNKPDMQLQMPAITQLQVDRRRDSGSKDQLSKEQTPFSRSSPKIKGTESPVEMEDNGKLKQMSTLFGQFEQIEKDQQHFQSKGDSRILQSYPRQQGPFIINPRLIKAKKFSNSNLPAQIKNKNADLAQTMYVMPREFAQQQQHSEGGTSEQSDLASLSKFNDTLQMSIGQSKNDSLEKGNATLVNMRDKKDDSQFSRPLQGNSNLRLEPKKVLLSPISQTSSFSPSKNSKILPHFVIPVPNSPTAASFLKKRHSTEVHKNLQTRIGPAVINRQNLFLLTKKSQPPSNLYQKALLPKSKPLKQSTFCEGTTQVNENEFGGDSLLLDDADLISQQSLLSIRRYANRAGLNWFKKGATEKAETEKIRQTMQICIKSLKLSSQEQQQLLKVIKNRNNSHVSTQVQNILKENIQTLLSEGKRHTQKSPEDFLKTKPILDLNQAEKLTEKKNLFSSNRKSLPQHLDKNGVHSYRKSGSPQLRFAPSSVKLEMQNSGRICFNDERSFSLGVPVPPGPIPQQPQALMLGKKAQLHDFKEEIQAAATAEANYLEEKSKRSQEDGEQSPERQKHIVVFHNQHQSPVNNQLNHQSNQTTTTQSVTKRQTLDLSLHRTKYHQKQTDQIQQPWLRSGAFNNQLKGDTSQRPMTNVLPMSIEDRGRQGPEGYSAFSQSENMDEQETHTNINLQDYEDTLTSNHRTTTRHEQDMCTCNRKKLKAGIDLQSLQQRRKEIENKSWFGQVMNLLLASSQQTQNPSFIPKRQISQPSMDMLSIINLETLAQIDSQLADEEHLYQIRNSLKEYHHLQLLEQENMSRREKQNQTTIQKKGTAEQLKPMQITIGHVVTERQHIQFADGEVNFPDQQFKVQKADAKFSKPIKDILETHDKFLSTFMQESIEHEPFCPLFNGDSKDSVLLDQNQRAQLASPPEFEVLTPVGFAENSNEKLSKAELFAKTVDFSTLRKQKKKTSDYHRGGQRVRGTTRVGGQGNLANNTRGARDDTLVGEVSKLPTDGLFSSTDQNQAKSVQGQQKQETISGGGGGLQTQKVVSRQQKNNRQEGGKVGAGRGTKMKRRVSPKSSNQGNEQNNSVDQISDNSVPIILPP